MSSNAQEPSAARRDLLLIALAFGSGAVDAISFLGLGRVFTANMTGNIVLLGLAAGQAVGSEVVRSAVSLVAYSAGVVVASLLTRRPGRPRAWPAAVTMTLILEALAQGGLLGGWLAVSGHPGAVLKAVLVGVSALAMGLQSGAVMALRVRGISTTYITGMLTGLLGELATLRGDAADWIRRSLVLAGLLLGAACAGLLLVHARDVAPVLPLAMTLLVAARGLWPLR